MSRYLLAVLAAVVLLAGAVAAQTRAVSLAQPGHWVATTGYGVDEYAHAGGLRSVANQKLDLAEFRASSR
ncbi:MAG TPA: hypothetical protein VL985_11485 [Stellaceae bacterium]|nr:hypothetical protein [Stellaceae bacterium]